MKIINENLIVRDAFNNIDKNLSQLKQLIPAGSINYELLYESLYDLYRELIGKQMWLHGDETFEQEVINEILDLDHYVIVTLEKVILINKRRNKS